MNREQRRSKIKQLKAKGFSSKEAEYLIELLEDYNGKYLIQDGDKVKFNIEMMESNKDFIKGKSSTEHHVKARNAFIYSNIDTIFTAEHSQDSTNILTLKEDTNDPKWLFWDGHLKKIDS